MEPCDSDNESAVEHDDEKCEEQTRIDFVPDIFSVKHPPKRKCIAKDAIGNGSSSLPKKTAATKKNKQIDTDNIEQHAASNTANLKTIETSEGPKESGLLDSRDVPDADELYSENERMLSSFIRLHPMLSLDATSERTLSTMAALVDSYTLPTRELEMVSKTHDDMFLRPANEQSGERGCVNGEKCVCRWLAIFRYGEKCKEAFVCREFLLPSQLEEFQTSGKLPKVHGKCLICCRYFTAYTYTLARNQPNFNPKSSICLQAFGNKIVVDNPEESALSHSNVVGGEEGYNPDCLLYIDEKWVDVASARGDLGTLLWRPVVRFQSSDYEFVQDTNIDGGYRVIQVKLGSNNGAPDFSRYASTFKDWGGGGGIRLSSTVNRLDSAHIHNDFYHGGCIAAMSRLQSDMIETFPFEFRRVVVSVPLWITMDFYKAPTMVSARDAIEYMRRFARMNEYLLTDELHMDSSVPTWLIVKSGSQDMEQSIHEIIATCRMTYGAMLEAFARKKALDTISPTHIPTSAKDEQVFSRCCSDAYLCGLWTDAHAVYAARVIGTSFMKKQLSNDRVAVGIPCVRLTRSVSALPLIADQFVRFFNGKSFKADGQTKSLMILLVRCTQSGSRGWEPSLKSAISNTAVRNVCNGLLLACCVGMHPQLHPMCRPTWQRRHITLALLESVINTHSSAILLACNSAVKECMRIYLCSLMNDIPAMRSATASCGLGIGLFTSSPVGIANSSLHAAAQNLVNGGEAAAKAIAEARKSKHPINLKQIFINEIQKCMGGELRSRKRTLLTARKFLAASAKFQPIDVVYGPSWVSRGQPTYLEDVCGVPMAMDIARDVLSKNFRMQFIPFWLHGHANGSRIGRLNRWQYQHMHENAPSHRVTALLNDAQILSMFRKMTQNRLSSFISVHELAQSVGVDGDNLQKFEACKNVTAAISILMNCDAESGAKFLTYCKLASLKEKFLAYDLGPRTRKMQLKALGLRYELEDSANIEADLPPHASNIYWCTECNRVPNACVEGGSKNVLHNEVGVSQTMQRVAGLGGDSDIRCARRSSAALRTAQQKARNSITNMVEFVDVECDKLRSALEENGDVCHTARIRRDVKGCSEQQEHVIACGDTPMLKVSLIGKCIRICANWYALCSHCASIMKVDQSMRFGCELSCRRCDLSMLNGGNTHRSVPPAMDTTFCFQGEKTLRCRFCGKKPPSTMSASRFKFVRAPLDATGRNKRLPPPLRTAAYCSSHWRPWVGAAHKTMPMNVILAHISEKAMPVFGADSGRRATERNTIKKAKSTKSTSNAAIEKRMRQRIRMSNAHLKK